MMFCDFRALSFGFFLIASCILAQTLTAGEPVFTDVTAQAGLNVEHGYIAGENINEIKMMAGGVAVGDYDGDGLPDLYMIRGDIGANLLFRNMGDGTFVDMAVQAGVAITGERGCGPAFFDFDGDGWQDLYVGGVENTPPRLYRNLGNGAFENVSEKAGLNVTGNTFSASYGDYDRDGDLDLFMTHWIGYPEIQGAHLWRNNGDGTFTDVDGPAGITGYEELDFTFTPNFTDINNDGWPDLLVAGDFGTSRAFINKGDGSFDSIKPSVFTDENGMGSAIGDYDNDGDLDWFVSSVYNPIGEPTGPGGMTGFTGNRLYRNLGDGTFEDATDEAGVRIGYWGWAGTFVDLDQDGHLDLIHTNGFRMPGFENDPTRLFMSNGDGSFRERSVDLGIKDNGQGRGLISFDYDMDGDRDILITNNSAAPILYRNDGTDLGNYLTIQLKNTGMNSYAIGARIYVTIGDVTQMREVRCNNNFTSHQPADAHFGLGSAGKVDQVRILWPDGKEHVLEDVAVNVFMILDRAKLNKLQIHRPDRRSRTDM